MALTTQDVGEFIDDDILGANPGAQIALIQELLERSLELARIGGFQLDLQTGTVTLLPQTSRILGVAWSESLTLDAFTQLFAANGHAELGDAIAAAIATGKGFEFDLPLKSAADSTIWIHITAEVVWFGSKPARIVGALQDVSRSVALRETLRYSTERMELAADAGDIGVWERDLITGERHWNDVLFRIYGRPRVGAEELRSMWINNLHPEDKARAELALARAVSGEAEFNVEYRIVRPTGEARYLKAVARTQRNAAGVALRMVGINIDITDRVEALQREAARAQAEQANSAKSQFLATMSHEIRTPINGIIGMVELVSRTSLTDDQRKMMATVESSSRALLRIVNDILDLSKIEAGKLEIDNEPMSVCKVVEETSEMLGINMARKNARVDCFVDPQIPPVLIGDAGRVGQILANLANNAAKFSSTNTKVLPRISVRAERAAASSADTTVTVRFTVEDNGIGMTQSVVDKLFQPFTQAEQSTSRVYGGTGLGLSICARLVELMGGAIGVSSEPGVGSVFTVTLPFAIAEDTHAGDEAPDLSGINVLVLRGSGLNGDSALAYLRAGGARAVACDDPKQVLPLLYADAASQVATDVVVMDSELSASTCADLCLTLRRDARFGKLGLVALSARTAAANNHEFPGDALTKVVPVNPLTRAQLLEATAVVVGRKKDMVQVAADLSLPSSREAAEACGRLLLVAEDNEVNQDLIQRQLNTLGYMTDIAGNGREALAMVDGRRYAALLTDCHMPEMDGYELCEAIRLRERSRGGHLPIVALSADVMASHYTRCAEVGMDGHWSKPLVMDSLRDGLVRLLGGASKQDAPAPAVSPQPALSAGALDLTKLKEMVGDDADAQHAILRKYSISSGKIVSQIVAALDQKAAPDLGALAHKLKSSSRAIGANAVADLCAELENAGKGGRLADCAPLVGALGTQFRLVVAAIEKVISHG